MDKKFETFSLENTLISNMFFEDSDLYTLVFEINSYVDIYNYYKDEQDISKFKNTEMSLWVKYSPFEVPNNNLQVVVCINNKTTLERSTRIMSFCKKEYEFFIDLCETYCMSKFRKTAKEIITDELLDMNLTA